MKILSLKLSKNSSSDLSDETPILGDVLYRDGDGNIQISLGNQNPTAKELVIFTKQFSTMLGSGIPMVQSLGLLSKQVSSRNFRKAIRNCQTSVENGSTLSNALSMTSDIFNNLYVAMVKAGEASGNLDTILTKLVSYIEKAEKIKNQVKSAMTYPTLVIVVALFVITGLLAFVVPIFAQQFRETGRDLPHLTQIILDASNILIEYWYVFLGGGLISLISFKIWIKTPSGRKIFDGMILNAPGLGSLLKKVAIGRFCSTISSMLSAGVNLLEALSICASTSGNKTIELFILDVRLGLEQGLSFSESLSKGNLFPEMVVSMVKVGEASGALDSMLIKVSEFYEEEVELAVQTLLAMIEPIMVVVIGGIVGFIVIAMYLPIFDMAGGVG